MFKVPDDDEPSKRVSTAKKNWNMGGSKLMTLGRLFNHQEIEEDDGPYKPAQVRRQFTFPIKGEIAENGGIKTFRNIETDFNEIARSDQRVDSELLRQYAYELITSKTFKSIMMIAIILNTILMVLPMIMGQGDTADKTRVPLSILENIIIGIFIVEIFVKYFALQNTFWYDSWNIFDVLVISILWLSSNTLMFGHSMQKAGASVSASRILRFIKVLRSMKSVKALKDKLTGLSLVIDTIVTTIPELAYLLFLMTIISILFIILGGTLFADERYLYIHFQDFVEGFFTTFVVLTQDGWVKKFEAGFDYYYEDPVTNETVCLLWIVLYILMVVLFGFIIGSIFVTQVVTNLDKAMLEQNEDDRKEEDKDDILAGVFEGDDYDEADKEEIKRDIREREIKMDYLTDFTIFAQHKHKGQDRQVLHKCPNGKRNSERVEDKLILLEALERNLNEYNGYREQLVEIIEEIKHLNDPATTNEEALRILTCTKNSRFSQSQRKNNSVIRNSFAHKMAGRASSKVVPNFDRTTDFDRTLDSNRLR